MQLGFIKIVDERKWDIQVDDCLLTEGVGCSLENTTINERDLHATGRRRDGGEESNCFSFLFFNSN